MLLKGWFLSTQQNSCHPSTGI